MNPARDEQSGSPGVVISAGGASGPVPLWSRSPGVMAATAAVLVIAAVALIGARVDVAVVALPLVIALVIAHQRRPPAGRRVSVELSVGESTSTRADYRLSLDTGPGIEAIVMRYSVLGGRPHEVVLAARRPTEAGGSVALMHSGPQELVRCDYRFLAADAWASSLPEAPVHAAVSLPPLALALSDLPLPHRITGMVGEHQSIRAGEGGDFREVGPYSPGDRLRRIDWKTTARWATGPGDLYVRRTSAAADAVVAIILDSRDDVGEQVASWPDETAARRGLSSLDLAREAAVSLAGAYIAAGDRVGFQDLMSRRRSISPQGGRRQLRRLSRAIELTVPSSLPYHPRRAPVIAPGALIYLLSSLLDDELVRPLLGWAARGRRVIVIDTLAPARYDRATRFERAAHRMVMIERVGRIQRLRAAGIEVLAWRSDRPGGLPVGARLAGLSRPGRGSAGAAVRRSVGAGSRGGGREVRGGGRP